MGVFDNAGVCHEDPVYVLGVTLYRIHAHRTSTDPKWTDFVIKELRRGGVSDDSIPDLITVAWDAGYALPMTPTLQALFHKSIAARYAKTFGFGPRLPPPDSRSRPPGFVTGYWGEHWGEGLLQQQTTVGPPSDSSTDESTLERLRGFAESLDANKELAGTEVQEFVRALREYYRRPRGETEPIEPMIDVRSPLDGHTMHVPRSMAEGIPPGFDPDGRDGAGITPGIDMNAE
ncbi:MAG TPA: hypothetical protein VNH11_20725 [Pirellulales bacterium]|nr:hypothetical protein [Pirellulales bacterium]